MSGFIYLATNKFMPGVVKIGYTTQRPEGRVAQVGSSSVVGSFDLRSSFAVNVDPIVVEALMHRIFAPHRIDGAQDYFTLDIDQAIAAFDLANLLSDESGARIKSKAVLGAMSRNGSRKEWARQEIISALEVDGVIQSLGAIASDLGVGISDISRWTDEWAEAGLMEKRRNGKAVALHQAQKNPPSRSQTGFNVTHRCQRP